MNYYQFHIGDYAVHTRHLSLLEDLAYRRLLDWYYTNEKPIPLDHEKAARLIGMQDHTKEVSNILSDFFLKSDAGYINKRCDKEISKYKEKADRAKNANSHRWKSETDLKSDADQIPTTNQEPRTKNQEKPIGRLADRFHDFWQAYPKEKRVKKKTALEIWKRKNLDSLADQILQDIPRRLSSDRRWKEGFIPDPTTYLNQERWTDELDTSRPTGGNGKPEWAKLPREDEKLWDFAKQHGFSNPGTLNYFDYRRKLQTEVEARMNQ